MIGTLLVLSCFWASGVSGFDVLMVIGNTYTTGQVYKEMKSSEIKATHDIIMKGIKFTKHSV